MTDLEAILTELHNLSSLDLQALQRHIDDMPSACYNEDAQGNYTTPTLPNLRLNVPTLWHEELPSPAETVKAIAAMLEQTS